MNSHEDTSKNLLCDSIHPQGVGRWVPGCHAATHPLAALRGVGSGVTRYAHEPAPKLRFRFLAYLWLISHAGIAWLIPVFAVAALVFGTVNGLIAARFMDNTQNHPLPLEGGGLGRG